MNNEHIIWTFSSPINIWHYRSTSALTSINHILALGLPTRFGAILGSRVTLWRTHGTNHEPGHLIGDCGMDADGTPAVIGSIARRRGISVTTTGVILACGFLAVAALAVSRTLGQPRILFQKYNVAQRCWVIFERVMP
jgi:hypothetical protein